MFFLVNKLNISVKTKHTRSYIPYLFAAILTVTSLISNTASAAYRFNEYLITQGTTRPSGIVSDPARGSLWYASTSSSGNVDTISRITTSGVITDFSAVPAGYAYVSIGTVALGSDGNIWFTACARNTTPDNQISFGSLNPATGAVNLHSLGYSCSGASYYPGPIALGPDGGVWFTINSYYGSTSYLYSVTTDSIQHSKYSWPSTNLRNSSLITGSDGNIWLASSSSNTIQKLTYSSTTGSITGRTNYLVPFASTSLSLVNGPDGNIWFADDNDKKIGSLLPDGTFTIYSLPSGVDAYSITSGADGAMWFVSATNNSIGRITTSGAVTVYASPNGGALRDIASGSDGGIWFTELSGNKIGRIGY
jgi:streptogramin lyase